MAMSPAVFWAIGQIPPDEYYRICVYCARRNATQFDLPWGRTGPACFPCYYDANGFWDEGDGAHLDRIRIQRAACFYRRLCLPTTPDAPNLAVHILLDLQLATIICECLIRI